MTTHNNKQLDRLKSLLKDLFQLDQPELDFGLYKIMHAKSVQITRFLENDLLKEIESAFGARDGANAEQLVAQAKAKLFESLGDTALDANGELNPAFAALPAGKKYLEDMAAAQAAKESLSADAEIYDHLYRFFERYYDNGDFLSRRYYARESDTRAAPYSVPYDGREVYLHWANKDQYYIKSGENFTHYTFDLIEAVKKHLDSAKTNGQDGAFDFEVPTTGSGEQKAMKVHLRIAEAQEGEHGNVKATGDQKREFIPLLSKPAELDTDGSLVLNFEYKVLTEGYPFDEVEIKAKFGNINKEHMPAHWMADVFLQAMVQLPEGKTADYMRLLSLLAPTDKQTKRPLLAKYISLYTARNTMDYFIHKDLGGFLRRELDFYIKNEVMRLDDIENADAPKVEQYLGKVKVLRRIAHQLISFLAQLEDFQKKLWLKKKFVTQVNYCITLDRIPEKFYPEIAKNEAQREEWVKLFAINQVVGDAATVGYSEPLTVEFIKANPYLIVDTALLSDVQKVALLSELQNLDQACDGVLIHSENFQGLNLLQNKYSSSIKCIYTDPPYNTSGDGFPYKDAYKHSSWASMMFDRLMLGRQLLSSDGLTSHYIDENEHLIASLLLSIVFGEENRAGDIVWKNSSKNDQSYVSMQHEYLISAVKSKQINKGEWTERKEGLSEIYAAFDGFRAKHGDDWDAIHKDALAWYGQFPESSPIVESKHYSWMDKVGVYFPSDISGPNHGQYVYDVIHPKTKKVVKAPASGWRFPEATMLERIQDDLVHFGKDETTIPNNKTYLRSTENQSLTSIKYRDGRVASKALNAMFGEKTFSNPKDVELSARFLKAFDVGNSCVLDFFAGTGTTGHASIELRRQSILNKFILIEQNNYFDGLLLPRLKKAIYSRDWKRGVPVDREGISYCIKYLRLESYEDALNNLIVSDAAARARALEASLELRSAYMLNYWLDVETQGSPSLLNVQAFADPTNYAMKIKKPGSDALALQRIDLIETFNWLIGLWVEHLAAPQTFSAEFEREIDKDLPKDQNTRLVCKRLKQDDQGPYWFRLVEGYTLKVPGDDSSRQKTLVVWRKLTDNPEQDNAALQKFLLEKLQISPRENTYAVIYVNGSHTLPNPLVEAEQTKVRLIEEAFHAAMWSQEAN